MWILVIGLESALSREGGAAMVLAQLGCEVRTAHLWERLENPDTWGDEPPACIVIEAMDVVEPARSARERVRMVPLMAEIPIVLAVTVSGLSSVRVRDEFEEVVLLPYVPSELYLRIRRAEWANSDFANQNIIKMGSLAIDLAAHEVRVAGRVKQLTQQEFALIRFFCRHRGRVFSRAQLLERVWGVSEHSSTRTVDIHVRRLRAKLGDAVDALETVRGVGYKMNRPEPR